MFAGKKSKKAGSSSKEATAEHELTTDSKEQQARLLATKPTAAGKRELDRFDGYDERQSFLVKHKLSSGSKAKLAKQEILDEHEAGLNLDEASGKPKQSSLPCCSLMLRMMLKWKWVLIPIFIICCMAAIYCIPFIDIEPRVPMSLPHIPFNYREGPLRASTASQFQIERLFANQISGPESVAFDSQANMYMVIEGGFVLYAHLNKSSVPKRTYYINEPPNSPRSQQTFDVMSPDYTDLVKIAELNGVKQLSQVTPQASGLQQKRRSASMERVETRGAWRRECQLDEQIYGQTLYTETQSTNDIDSPNNRPEGGRKFVSNVAISRCSKPLGIRLSPDESHLYVVDTLSGLYRVDLKNPERPFSTQRSVTKLIDFRANNRHHLLPVVALDEAPSQPLGPELSPLARLRQQQHVNISLMAIDDLVIDYGAGTRGGDMIYLSDASQNWQAISFVFDMLEGRPSGAILRYDTGINHLSVLSPSRVAHVRTSVLDFDDENQVRQRSTINRSAEAAEDRENYYLGLGAPRLDENDIFDDRPLNFPNGLELTDDKQAILIADTTNKRIIKHYIRGSRRGTSDLWAWTPNFPDNIRRGYDKRYETYWVVGCGEDMTSKFDMLSWLQSWPKLRKYILKNIYLFGWFVESIGDHLLGSQSIRDFGYSLRSGNRLCESFCSGMMVLQYDKHGQIVRSIYSREFPNDISLYSQVNEVIDAQNEEHALYLSSPTYKYVTKLVLPSNPLDVVPSSSSFPS